MSSFLKVVSVLGLAASVSGCITTDTVRFQANGASQQAMVRDGRQAIVSKKKDTIVIVNPATRELASGRRPVFVVGIANVTKQPLEFRVDQISVTQIKDGAPVHSLQVATYEKLVSEERGRQVAAAILVGLAAGANAAAASNAGYGRTYGSYTTPSGRVGTFSATTYSPVAASIAQANASAENDAMISSTVENGRRNMAVLEREIIKDNTMLPGEWYGGQLHFDPPEGEIGQPKSYIIAIKIGADIHEIEVVQEPQKT